MNWVILTVLALTVAPLKPPPPILEYPVGQINRGEIQYRCYDGGAPMIIRFDFSDGNHLVSWSHGQFIATKSELAEVDSQISKIKMITHLKETCNKSSEEIMFLGTNNGVDDELVIASHADGYLWVIPYIDHLN